jgi:hypothetical protein
MANLTVCSPKSAATIIWSHLLRHHAKFVRAGLAICDLAMDNAGVPARLRPGTAARPWLELAAGVAATATTAQRLDRRESLL